MSQIIAREIQALEMAPDEALVVLYELELVEGAEPLYFHSENTESVIKFNNGASGTQPKEYDPFPISLETLEIRGDGAQARPKMTIPNVESLFLPNSAMDTDTTDALNSFQMEDLIGKRITRRQTLSKYVQVGSGTAPTNNFQLPKATYVIDRISAKTSIAVELELASPFDLQKVQVPSRIVTGKYCPWLYKGLTLSATDDEFDVKSACFWQSTRESGDPPQDVLLFFTIDDEPLVHSSLLGNTTYVAGNFPKGSVAFLNGVYYQSLRANGVTDDPSQSKTNWRLLRTYTHWDPSTPYTIDTAVPPDNRKNSYVYDLDANSEPTIWKAIAPSTGKRPKDNPRFWNRADVCGKLLASCKVRYQGQIFTQTVDSDGNSLTNITAQQPKIIADTGDSNRRHGLPDPDFDTTISMPFGGFPGTRRIR